MRILGLDPGLAVTGWGVIECAGDRASLVEFGSISTGANFSDGERLSDIYRGVLEVIDTFSPRTAAIEELFGGVNIKSALSVGQARGAIILACAERDVATVDYTPLRIKQAVVGYGRAGKEQMQQMVKSLLGLDDIPRPDHAADALGAAICHAHSCEVEARLKART